MLEMVVKSVFISFFLPFSCLSYYQERTATLSALAEKAKLTEQVLNTVDGISCNPVQGAMYSFPRITIPEKAIQEAKVSSELSSSSSDPSCLAWLSQIDYIK